MRGVPVANGETTLRLLVAHAANPNLRDTQGNTALTLARGIADPARRNSVIGAIQLSQTGTTKQNAPQPEQSLEEGE